MRLIQKILQYDHAIYWAPDGTDDYGLKKWKSPIEISVRWEDRSEVVIDAKGNTFITRALVYVDRDVQLLGFLWHGTFHSIKDVNDPLKNEGAYEIRRVDELPDARNVDKLRQVFV